MNAGRRPQLFMVVNILAGKTELKVGLEERVS